jgi:hypothetical protein
MYGNGGRGVYTYHIGKPSGYIVMINLSWIAGTIRTRILHSDNDFLLLFYGKRGTGKSISSVSLAMEIDPTFTEKRIIFNIEQLIQLINSGELRRGMAIVFDELGVAANVKEHSSQANKAASYLLQTIRPFNLCVIFSTPKKNYIDKQLRPLFDMYIKMTSRKFINKLAKGRMYWVQDNEEIGDSGKIYRHHPETMVDGEICDITTIYFIKPHDSIVQRYRVRRKEFVQGISQEQGDIINVKKAYLRRESAKEIGDSILASKRQIQRYKRRWPGGQAGAKWRIDQDLIATDYGTGNKTAYKVKKYLEAKLIRRI